MLVRLWVVNICFLRNFRTAVPQTIKKKVLFLYLPGKVQDSKMNIKDCLQKRNPKM